MSATPKDDITIAKHFVNATNSIFATMTGIKPVIGRPYVKKNDDDFAEVSALIGVTGAKVGTIAVSFERKAAISLLHAMLGDDINDVDTDMQDIVGELANMISGQARASLDAAGLNLQGSTPSVVSGKHHHITHKAGGAVMVIPFDLDGGKFVVEFCFKN